MSTTTRAPKANAAKTNASNAPVAAGKTTPACKTKEVAISSDAPKPANTKRPAGNKSSPEGRAARAGSGQAGKVDRVMKATRRQSSIADTGPKADKGAEPAKVGKSRAKASKTTTSMTTTSEAKAPTIRGATKSGKDAVKAANLKATTSKEKVAKTGAGRDDASEAATSKIVAIKDGRIDDILAMALASETAMATRPFLGELAIEDCETDSDDASPPEERKPSLLTRSREAVSRIGRHQPTQPDRQKWYEEAKVVRNPSSAFADLIISESVRSPDKPKQLRVVGYLRYSTPNQSIMSLIRQAGLIREYARLHGMIIIAIFKDQAVSGTKENREGLNAAIAMIQTGEADILLAEDCDRFARRHSILTTLFEKVEDYNGQLWTLNRGHIADASAATLYGLMAAEDHKKTVNRFEAGRRAAIRRGRLVTLPYGYTHVDTGYWVVNPVEEKVVQLIFKLYLLGMATNKIAWLLAEGDVPAHLRYRTSPQQIRAILRNPIYVGVYLWGRHHPKRSPKAQPTVVVEVPRLTIVSKEDFEAAAIARKARAQKAKPHKRRHYSDDILKGRVFCADTGRKFLKTRDGIMEIVDKFGTGRLHSRLSTRVLQKAVFEAIEKRLLTGAGETMFDQERAKERKRERKSIESAKRSLSARITHAVDKARESMADDWKLGASEDDRILMRSERYGLVEDLKHEMNMLKLRERALDEANVVQDTLKKRLARFKKEGVGEARSLAVCELIHAVRSVLVRVDIQIGPDGSIFNVITTLAPSGDAEFAQGDAAPRSEADQAWTEANLDAFDQDGSLPKVEARPPVETVADEVRLYKRMGRHEADEFMGLITAALEKGWLAFSERDFLSIVDRTPAFAKLPLTWTKDDRMTFLRNVLVHVATNLPIENMYMWSPIGGRWSRAYSERFKRVGGPAQLLAALVSLKPRIAGLPAIDDRENLIGPLAWQTLDPPSVC